MSVLSELLAIKSFRENKAEMAVHRQRTTLREAQEQFERALRELDDFRGWATRREREMFDDLCARTVRLRDIQAVQENVAEMRGQEHQHVQMHDQAQDRRTQEEVALDTAKQAHADATRMKEKFAELVRNHTVEVLYELERKEDAEMEEVAETRRDRSDWEEFVEEATP